MSDVTKIQWADSTVNAVMGCGGCELFPASPRKVMKAVDRAIQKVSPSWKTGMAAEIITDLIHKQVEKIKGQPRYSPEHHLDKLTDTNIWHLRKVFAKHLATAHGKEVADAALHEIRQQITCYAAILHLKRGYSILNPDRKAHKGHAPTFEQLKMFEGRVTKMASAPDLLGTSDPLSPWKDGLPRTVFVSDMGDAFAEHSPDHLDWLETEIMEPIRSKAGQRHLWLWLTKRPNIMEKFAGKVGGFPKNACAMTTLTGPDEKSLQRLENLKQVQAESRGLSIEPLWERIPPEKLDLNGIDWVIIGGESGHADARPFDLGWARELRDHCRTCSVAVFIKQLGSNPVEDGKPVPLNDSHGGDWNEWPEDLRIREFPAAFHQYRPIPEKLTPTRPDSVDQNKKKPRKNELTDEEKQRFRTLNSTVTKAARSVVDAAIALAEIKTRKLYRQKHPTFEAYVQEVHGMSRQYAYNLLKSGGAALEMSAIADSFGITPEQMPRKESHFRALSKVKNAETRCEILAEVLKEKGDTYTARDLTEKALETCPPPPPSDTPTPRKRMSQAHQEFQRLKEILSTKVFSQEEDEITKLLESLNTLLQP